MIGGRSCSDLALFLDNADDDDAFPASVESPSPSELHTLGDLGCLQKRSITISKRRQIRHLVFLLTLNCFWQSLVFPGVPSVLIPCSRLGKIG